MITEEQCIEIMHKICAEKGWTLRHPIKIKKGFMNWEIISNADMIGCNVRLTVDKKTGEIIKEKFLSR